jgi:steroid 5-alpha reductase family enzyme
LTSNADVEFWRGTTWVVTAYFVAFLVGLLVGHTSGAADPLWIGLYADVAATIAVFAFSFAFNNSSFYDAFWSVVPIALVAYWITQAGQGDPTRQALVMGGVTFWGVRLTSNWVTGWTGLDHEDWRYVDLRRQAGPLYWLVSLAGVHVFPTLMVFACLVSAQVAVTASGPIQSLDLLATLLVGIAVLLEATADRQLRAWRATGPAPEAYMDSGVWHYSRHPNYLGELLFWVGLWCFAMAADPTQWITVLGPLAMASMFRFISIPMMETRMVTKRPAYRDQIASTSMLFLWPPSAKPAPDVNG